MNSNSFDFSTDYNSRADDDGEIILQFLSKYPDLSNHVHVDFDTFLHPNPPIDPPNQNTNAHRSTSRVNTIKYFIAIGEHIVDEGYSYFHNSPHEIDPSTRTNIVQDLNITNLNDETHVNSVPTLRIDKNHPQSNIISDLHERITKSKSVTAHVWLFSCFLSQSVETTFLKL